MGIKFSQFIRAFDITDDAALVGLQDGSNKRFTFGLIKQWIKVFFTPAEIGAQEEITASGILKGDGQGGVSAATAGTDYGTYSKPSGGIPASDLASGVIPTVPSPSSSNPLEDGTVSPGSSSDYARGDHVHPHDTTKANQAQLATVESGSTASRAYSVGEYFCLNGLLYRVTAAISSGGTFTPGTNCEAVTVGGELQSLASTMKSFVVAPGHSLKINIPNNATRLQCLLASSGARTTTAILYFLSLYSANSNYHIINPIVTGSSISVSDSAGTTTITNNHANDTVTFIVLTLSSTGTVNYTVV